MAQLNQFLGTLLSELTQARVTSDIYSRDTSNFYQQDPVLRSYSVPRVNIDEFEMDMSFAIAGLVREQNTNDLPVKLDRIFATSGMKCAEKLSQITCNYFGSDSALEQDNAALRMMLLKLRNAGERSKIGYSLADRLASAEFQDQEHYFIPGAAVAAIVDLFLNLAVQHIELPANLKEDWVALKKELTEQMEELLADLSNTIRFLLENDENHNLDVEICADRLRERPTTSLCTLRLKGCFKNYVWSNSTQQDGSSAPKLVQE